MNESERNQYEYVRKLEDALELAKMIVNYSESMIKGDGSSETRMCWEGCMNEWRNLYDFNGNAI